MDCGEIMSGRVIAGFGCRRGCPAESIIAVLRRACALAGRCADALAAPEFKAGEAGLQEAAGRLGLALIMVEPASLAAAQARCVTHSVRAAQATGVASVAEGSALAAAGAGGRLILPRISGEGATCALAEAGAA
jgi:cobalamin biosynthesis protein CbiG